MVCLPSSLLSLPPAMSPVTRIDLMLKNNLYCILSLSHCMELRRDTSVLELACSHQCVLELHECTSKCFWNSRSARTSSCCSLHKCVDEANSPPKNLVLLGFQILSSVLDLSYSNELLHRYLAHLDHNGEPITSQISKSPLKASSL